MRFAAVLLPAPLGPIKPVMLPRATVKEQLSTACSPPKLFEMLRTSRTMVSTERAAVVALRDVASGEVWLIVYFLPHRVSHCHRSKCRDYPLNRHPLQVLVRPQ